jgi:hypothetical protein
MREQPTKMREQPTTVAILGDNAVVENALAQLLEGEGYATRVLKPFPLRGAQREEMPDIGSADLVVLAPSLSTSECDAFLAARRTRSSTSRRATRHRPAISSSSASPLIPVIVLCSPMREAPSLLEEDEQAARSVAWPTTSERLAREIEELLLEARFPSHREESFRNREGEIHK